MVGIGEHIWLGEIDENSFHNIDDPNCERRKKVSCHFLSDCYVVFLWVFVVLFCIYDQKLSRTLGASAALRSVTELKALYCLNCNSSYW